MELHELISSSIFIFRLGMTLLLSLNTISLAVCPFEKAETFVPRNEIDVRIIKSLEAQHLQPANLCSDEVFIRRVYLDVIGTLPEAQDVRQFLDNPKTDKRAALITTLLKSTRYADYWSLKWCDLLRVKAEFPINLWPNAVQAYHRWIHDSIQDNMPYDGFARELLTSSGSNFRVPQVNFYRAIQEHDPTAMAEAVALTFMGSRFESWPNDRQKGMAVFFSRIAFKATAEWKEEIVYLNPAPAGMITAIFPDGQNVQIDSNQDPRQVFADWLITAENRWFARTIVNRIWYWLMGRGLINEPDDIRPDNPPIHPEVLAYLEKELVKSGYNLRHIYELILGSATYQQSSIPQGDPIRSEHYLACYPVRQLDAEVLIDALCQITGTTEEYSSPIPEPFTFIPEQNRSIELADGSITSQFLEMFGRPSRDTGLISERQNEPSAAQRREILNSTHIQNKIERSVRVNAWIKNAKNKQIQLVNIIYLNILSRYPTESEQLAVKEYIQNTKINTKQAAIDLTWALLNSKEFLYKH
jgi:hypothetical protein